jgi:hypothetical protein
MISVLGIGKFCSQLCSYFSVYPQYKTYSISTDKETGNSFVLPVYKNAEEYEKRYPEQLNNYICDNNTDISVFIDGSEAISGIILKLLETLKNKNISIFYIRSDLDLVSNIEKIQDKICFSVLQEYTRSGLFTNFICIDKNKIEKILNNVSILEFDEKFFELISSTVHYVNVYNNIKPILSNNIETSEISRIETYGLSHIGTSDITWFFDLENIEEIVYYFAINSNTLKKEKNLLQTIKNQVKEKQKQNIKILFNIYETSYEQNFVYCISRTKFIQPPKQA